MWNWVCRDGPDLGGFGSEVAERVLDQVDAEIEPAKQSTTSSEQKERHKHEANESPSIPINICNWYSDPPLSKCLSFPKKNFVCSLN